MSSVTNASNQGAAASRRLAGQSDGSDNLSATLAADRAFPAAVAEFVDRSTYLKSMNADKLRITLAIALITFIQAVTHAADTSIAPKETVKSEERMKEEKRKDEQQARDYAGKVKVARFDSMWRSPRTDDIDIIQAGETASRPYKAIALLTFECAAHEETQAVAGFIVKAKDLGGDGVILIRFDAPNSNQAVNNIFSPNDRRVFRANAIVYQGPK